MGQITKVRQEKKQWDEHRNRRKKMNETGHLAEALCNRLSFQNLLHLVNAG